MAGIRDRTVSEWTADDVRSNFEQLDLDSKTKQKFSTFDGAMISILSKSDFMDLHVPVIDYIRIQALISQEKDKQEKRGL
jgi:hypothetical protein